MNSSAARALGDRADAFELAFTSAGGIRREPLSACWSVPFERLRPARGFASFRGQGNFPGLWWCATTGEHVGYESWLERDHVMIFDADPEVVAVASQPFWLHWSTAQGSRRHAPDYFVRLRDGSAVVIDVRADDAIEDRDAEAFAVTARACDSVGWAYRRVGQPSPVLTLNLRWLAGYRHPRCRHPQHTEALQRVFAAPMALLDGVRAVGEPIAVLPTLFHLLWRGEAHSDVAATVLGARSLVTMVAGP